MPRPEPLSGGRLRLGEAQPTDTDAVLTVERAAFGRDDEADLVRELLSDLSARPLLSLLAREDDRPVGHILFSAARLDGAPDAGPIAILAPLAVVPDAQRRGVGGALVERGLQQLGDSGVGLVFVLGHPSYYPRHGFRPAGPLGFDPPFTIPDEAADAWMVQGLRADVVDTHAGTVVCADSMNRPEHWRE